MGCRIRYRLFSRQRNLSCTLFLLSGIRKKIPENRPLLKEAADTDIRYRDNEGEWVVGNLAYEEMDASKMTESEEEVFGRKRYYSPMFKVIVRTGLGIALMEGKRKIVRRQKAVRPDWITAEIHERFGRS